MWDPTIRKRVIEYLDEHINLHILARRIQMEFNTRPSYGEIVRFKRTRRLQAMNASAPKERPPARIPEVIRAAAYNQRVDCCIVGVTKLSRPGCLMYQASSLLRTVDAAQAFEDDGEEYYTKRGCSTCEHRVRHPVLIALKRLRNAGFEFPRTQEASDGPTG